VAPHRFTQSAAVVQEMVQPLASEPLPLLPPLPLLVLLLPLALLLPDFVPLLPPPLLLLLPCVLLVLAVPLLLPLPGSLASSPGLFISTAVPVPASMPVHSYGEMLDAMHAATDPATRTGKNTMAIPPRMGGLFNAGSPRIPPHLAPCRPNGCAN
jgi:hypothetical protein